MFRVFNCLGTEHDWRLVVLAAIVCFLASFAAVGLFLRARALQGRARAAWILIAGAAAGCGVWATHFISVLAFDPGFPIAYDIVLTALSLVVAIAVITVGFAWALYGRHGWSAAMGGAVVGVGIASMHFVGMAGLRIPGTVIWSADLLVASIVLGIIFGAAALAISARNDRLGNLVAGACLLTLAIVSLHFTAMGAVGIIPDTFRTFGPDTLSPGSLAIAVAAVAGSLLAMCMIGAIADRASRQKIKEQNLRLDGALNNMNQGLCMFDADNKLVVWNQRYVDMYNIDPKRIWLGCTVRDLLDARIAAGTFPLNSARYDADLRAAIKHGKTFTVNVELADGRVIAVVNHPMQGGGWVAMHDDITERKRAERELEHTRHFLDTIIENVPSPILVKEVPGLRYLLLNRAAEKYLGVGRETMLGKTAREVLPAESAETIEAEDKKLIAAGRTAFWTNMRLLRPATAPASLLRRGFRSWARTATRNISSPSSATSPTASATSSVSRTWRTTIR